MSIDDSRRRRLMSAFTLAGTERLAEGLGRIVPEPEYDFPRRPESGLIMVRGRIGGQGRAFNLGEMLVTRCAVRYRDRLGHGWAPGRDPRRAELAALGDALGQMPEHARAVDRLVEELEAERNEGRARRRAEVKKTRVQFFTLVRGEDEHD